MSLSAYAYKCQYTIWFLEIIIKNNWLQTRTMINLFCNIYEFYLTNS